MTARRAARLMPGGVPRWVRCYDNSGETADRYTVVFTGRYHTGNCRGGRDRRTHADICRTFVLSLSERPFHPQGVGLSSELPGRPDVNASGFAPAVGRRNHLGTRIPYDALPSDCQRAVMQEYREIWNLGGEL